MRNQLDDYEKKIIEKLDQEAREIERRIEENPQMAEFEADEGLDRKVYAEVEAYEKAIAGKAGADTGNMGRAENTDISDVTGLSKDDLEALRLGRELQRRRRKKKHWNTLGEKTRKFVGGWKRIVAAAVVLVLIAGVGVDSIGGPNRVVEIVKGTFGGRESSRVNSSTKDAKIVKESREEEAYQQIKDELGIDPVKIIRFTGGIKFKNCEVNSDIRVVQILYEYGQKNISYLMDASYTKETWGTDIEDEKINEYPYVKGKLNAKIAEYYLSENKEKKYSAEFEYKGIYYQIVGTVKWEEFEKILINLHFPS